VSTANVDVVRASFEAWKQGDFERSLSHYAEDATWQTGAVDDLVRCGRGGVARAVEEWVGTFTGYWLEADELIDAGDRVVALGREGGAGRASGVPVEEKWALVFRLDSGRIVEARGYTDHAEALADAGLS
jgi:ketosteroid isomerase-like protein